MWLQISKVQLELYASNVIATAALIRRWKRQGRFGNRDTFVEEIEDCRAELARAYFIRWGVKRAPGNDARNSMQSLQHGDY